MIRWARTGAVLGVLLVATGCSFPSNDYERDAAIQLAQSHFGPVGEVKYYDVVSAGVGRDTIFVWGARFGLVTEPQERLAKVLRASGPLPLHMAVSGPVPDKTFRIVEGALERARGLDLAHVQLLVIGGDGDRAALEKAARGAGVHLTVMPLRALRKVVRAGQTRD